MGIEYYLIIRENCLKIQSKEMIPINEMCFIKLFKKIYTVKKLRLVQVVRVFKIHCFQNDNISKFSWYFLMCTFFIFVFVSLYISICLFICLNKDFWIPKYLNFLKNICIPVFSFIIYAYSEESNILPCLLFFKS